MGFIKSIVLVMEIKECLYSNVCNAFHGSLWLPEILKKIKIIKDMLLKCLSGIPKSGKKCHVTCVYNTGTASN